ncbi:D-alanine--D-alanyl carrier protein ligase [Candidatus Entotheonellaceae bacterium PAL068K]
MKTTEDFLADLRHLDVRLWAEGDELCLNAPKGILSSELRAEIVKRKADILAFLSQAALKSIQTERIQPTGRHAKIPLSFAQQRLWFLDQLIGPSAAYNIPAGIHISGQLEIPLLERAFNEIVRRHEILRTTFPAVDGQPVQAIAPTLTLPLRFVDLQHVSKPQQDAVVNRLAAQEARQLFDLARGPLFRYTLLRLAAVPQPCTTAHEEPPTHPTRQPAGHAAHNTEHILLVNMHHIISDGWSIGVLTRELTTLYTAFSMGQPSPLPELSIQYADFAQWQRQWLSGEVLQRQLHYWRQQLHGAPTLLELPTDHPRPAVQSFNDRREPFALDPDLTEQLEDLGQQFSMSLFLPLYTAFVITLFRYSGQEDIVVGVPIANRNRQEIESLIGFFINTLALRTDLSGSPTCRELLERLRQVALDAYAYQDLPFERLVEELQPHRTPSHAPLFQALFAWQNQPQEVLELPGLTLTPLERENVTAGFDLTLSLETVAPDPSPGNSPQIKGWLGYNTDLFEAATIQRMLGHFKMLVAGMVAHPDQRIGEVPLLTEAERHQLLVAWNDTRTAYAQDHGIHQLFAEQVERTPDGIAVVGPMVDTEPGEAGQLTYRALNARATQLAHHLQALGVGSEGLVGVCVERSVAMLVGLLGILKAGGAYVPLDPAYPPERLAFMLEDAAIRVLLATTNSAAQLPPHQAHIVYLDQDLKHRSQNQIQQPSRTGPPEGLAYMIYTSGSTGHPKGVLVAHRGLCNLAQAQIRAFGVARSSAVLQFASLSFDASIAEIVMALCTGATLYLAPTRAHGPALEPLLHDYGISHIILPPSVLAVLPPADLPALQSVIVAGEACPPALVQQWLPGRRFFNAYGPTEATVCATIAEVTSAELSDLGRPPIGRPIANTQVYILDPSCRPTPIGVPGELHIGGVGLARGYHNRPALTAERFIPNPFAAGRLYKTGDLARYLPDGNIEFLGRIDHQVKFRGFRIELGEIEAVLAAYPAVRDTVVMLREDTPDDKRLVAYVVLKEPQLHQALADPRDLKADLRTHLKRKLPDYMVSMTFLILDALPLTPNGKIDRRALPAPDGSDVEDGYVAPRTSTEKALATIWADVLGLDRVGVHGNFFDLGGHSLLAVQLLALIEQQFATRLPLTMLFQHATIEQLASVLHQSAAALAWSPLVPLQPHGTRRPFFCVPGGGGFVTYLAPLAQHLGQDQPVYGLQARGLDGISAPHTRMEEMAAQYIQAMKTVQPEGPYVLGGHSLGGRIAFEMAQQLQKQGDEVALLAIFDTQAPNPDGVPPSLAGDEVDWLTFFAVCIEELTGKKLAIGSDTLRGLAADARLEYLYQQFKRVDWLPIAGMTELRGLIQVFKTAFHLYWTPQEVYPTRIALFRTSPAEPAEGENMAYLRQLQERLVSLPEARDGQQETWGWETFAAGSVEMYPVPGNHFTMMHAPHVRALARQLKACLWRAVAAQSVRT